MKKKFVFLGDTDSINIEIISKSHQSLKNKLKYIIIGNNEELSIYLERLSSNLKINEIYDPIKFTDYKIDYLNIFNVQNISHEKSDNLLNQINISNYLANKSKFDLVTMPINKSVFKKKIDFTGMTEYFGKINNKNTKMLMLGDKFSIIPFTTHINLKNISKNITNEKVSTFIKDVLRVIKNKIYKIHFKEIKFLCYNPHCGENGTLGNEDIILKKCVTKFKDISGLYSADSAFNAFKKGTLFISTYHDQGLIPFKIINKKCINFTLGLNFRRLSPAHGTAKDIKMRGIADNSSYIECMKF